MQLINLETDEALWSNKTFTDSRNDTNDYFEQYELSLGAQTMKLSLVNIEQTYFLLKDFLTKEGTIKE